MLSSTPSKKRIVSPSKQLSSSPRGNKHGRGISGSDVLCMAFLKYFRWLVTGMLALSFLRMLTMEPLDAIYGDNSIRNQTYYDQTIIYDPNAPKPKPAAPVETSPIVNSDSDRSQVTEDKPPTIESTMEENDTDLLSSYNASNAPVILDGWDRTVQVHLIVDIAFAEDVDPFSKLLSTAIGRSQYLQLTAVTFVKPSIESFEIVPRNPELPLLFLIDWGSMDRDCHRLQLVLEQIELEQDAKDETEEPYFLLMDSTGSTRQTRCDYLFQDVVSNTRRYAFTNDKNRIRLAKRSIVQNRYYDFETNQLHLGEVAPNQWQGTPQNYDKPVLHSPMALRESFVMAIQNVTSGESLVPTKDGMRPIDVGYFWKTGDYSHYGFYRRDIARVIKTLHGVSVDKATGRRMQNDVGIVYTDDVRDMTAGKIQMDYIEKIVQCKIIVIAQRDEWEDHYRLMESLASGALVMTDSMVALPDGLQDKVNIVVYDNPKHLKELVRYYLDPKQKEKRKKIASKGYKLVMGRHRCWHRLEELLFGQPLTNAYQHDAPTPPKDSLAANRKH